MLKIRGALFTHNIDGIDGALNALLASDLSRSGQISKQGFESFLNTIKIFVSSQEVSELFRYFDAKKDGYLDTEEFAFGLK
jgi:Ca2+-binding EF-hand superfamily protein